MAPKKEHKKPVKKPVSKPAKKAAKKPAKKSAAPGSAPPGTTRRNPPAQARPLPPQRASRRNAGAAPLPSVFGVGDPEAILRAANRDRRVALDARPKTPPNAAVDGAAAGAGPANGGNAVPGSGEFVRVGPATGDAARLPDTAGGSLFGRVRTAVGETPTGDDAPAVSDPKDISGPVNWELGPGAASPTPDQSRGRPGRTPHEPARETEDGTAAPDGTAAGPQPAGSTDTESQATAIPNAAGVDIVATAGPVVNAEAQGPTTGTSNSLPAVGEGAKQGSKITAGQSTAKDSGSSPKPPEGKASPGKKGSVAASGPSTGVPECSTAISNSTKPAGQSETDKGATSGEDPAQSNASGKRPREQGDDNPSDQSKKQKGKEGGQQGGQGPALTVVDPCDDLASRLAHWRAVAAASTPVAGDFPAIWEQYLADETVMRAIYAVTEAISGNNLGVQFGLARFDTWLRPGSPDAQPFGLARPGQPTLMPYTANRHTFLLELRPTATANRFRLVHHDSWRGLSQNALAALSTRIRHALSGLEWGRNGDTISDLTSERQSTMDQDGEWECGIHTVVNAWALALGLPSIGRGTPTNNRRFLATGMELINLAVQGFLDSDTIAAFLKCFKVVPAASAVTAARHFHQTVRLLTTDDLNHRVTRIRLERELATLRQDDPTIASLDALLIEAVMDITDVQAIGAQALVDQRNQMRQARANYMASPVEPSSIERIMRAEGQSTDQIRMVMAESRRLEAQGNARQTSPTPRRGNAEGVMQAAMDAADADGNANGDDGDRDSLFDGTEDDMFKDTMDVEGDSDESEASLPKTRKTPPAGLALPTSAPPAFALPGLRPLPAAGNSVPSPTSPLPSFSPREPPAGGPADANEAHSNAGNDDGTLLFEGDTTLGQQELSESQNEELVDDDGEDLDASLHRSAMAYDAGDPYTAGGQVHHGRNEDRPRPRGSNQAFTSAPGFNPRYQFSTSAVREQRTPPPAPMRPTGEEGRTSGDMDDWAEMEKAREKK